MTRVLLACALLGCGAAVAAQPAIRLRVACPKPGSWTIDTLKTASGDVEEYELRLNSPHAAVPPRFEVSFDVPQLDAHHKWTPQLERVTMPPNWSCRTDSRLCSQMPLVSFLNDSDRNRICVSASEAMRNVIFEAGLREEDCRLVWKLTFFDEPEAPIAGYSVMLRIDRRDIFFGDAIREGADWIAKAGGLKPLKPPDAAFEPLYSAWYSFHQNVNDRDIEGECAEAAKLGMKTVIVDDGWQTDDNNRGYAYTGDWEISKRRFPDMAAHVKRVHALGMKYMLWYGVPMMGLRAKNHDRFKGKYLWTSESRWAGYSCLDPRFPEVREYVISLYEKALREWDIDGLKLDFIDAFAFHGEDPAIRENYAGRDIRALPAAVDRLMKDVFARLRAIKPDVLVEFRQGYMGPAIRQYGNMMRAADCPGDLMANRARTANLRLTSGETAVHADMLEWNRDETPENAARYVLATIFATIQYSVMLRTCPDSHKRMIAHWLGFSRDHRDALLHGSFRPHHFEAFYPWIEAEGATERIAAVYTGGTVVPVDAREKAGYVLNGTGEGEVVVDSASEATAEVFDTFGGKTDSVTLAKGLNKVPMPVSGYLRITDGASAVIAVSPTGKVRSLEQACEAVRALKAAHGGRLPGRVEVVFEDGVYPFSSAVGMGAADSGEPDNPVVYRAKHRGKAIFTGGRSLAWERPSADDPRLKLLPAAVRGEVRVATIPKDICLGSFAGGRTQRNGCPLWLYANEAPLPLAAWPNGPTGWNDLGRELAPIDASMEKLIAENEKDKAHARFRPADRPHAPWADEPELWAYGLWQFEWDDSFVRVKGVNADARIITIDASGLPFLPTSAGSYRMVNAFSELDVRGEWALDRANRRVYAWLPEGAVTAAAADRIVVAEDLSNVRFSGFVFANTRAEMLRFTNCRDIAVEASELRAAGGFGAFFLGCSGCRVEGCDIHDLGEGGVLLSGGDVKTLTHSGNAAVNNHVHHYGWRLPNYRAGITTGACDGTPHPPSVGARIEHNLIHHARHMGIGFGGYEDRIAYNIIHDTCARTRDAGPIYGYSESDWSIARGTVIEHNLVYRAGKVPYPDAYAIYVDGIVSGVTVRGNIVVWARAGLFQNGGQANVWERNLVVDCSIGIRRGDLGYGINHTRPDSPAWKNLQRNRALYHAPPWIDRHPLLARQSDIPDPAWAQCALFCVHSNNVVSSSGPSAYASENLKGLYVVTNELTMTGDPGFVDFAGFDWRLRPDSAARKVTGNLEFEKMGLRESPLRFSPAVKFGEGVTPVPPFAPPFIQPSVTMMLQVPGRVFTKESPLATDLYCCTDDLGWCRERNRLKTTFGAADMSGTWRSYSFGFTPTFDGEVVLEVRGAYGGKTCYDDFRVTGAELTNGDCEADEGWKVPAAPPDYAVRLRRSDLSRPWGYVASGGMNRAASGKRFLAANDDLAVCRRLSVKAGVRVTVSFQATAWR